MKCYFLAFISVLSCTLSFAQSVVPIRGDTVRIYKVGGNAELKVENATRARTGAFLKNTGNGWGQWAYALDSVYTAGDSLRFRYGTGYIAVKAGGGTDTKVTGVDITGTTTKTVTVTNSDGTTAAGTFTDAGTTYSTTDNALSITGTEISTRKAWNTITWSSSITVNATLSLNHQVTLAGTTTVSPTGGQDGDIMALVLIQDATGSRTVTWSSALDWSLTASGGPPTLKTAGGAKNLVTLQYHNASGKWYGFY